MATLTVSADVITKAGAGVGTVPADAWDKWITETEGLISSVTRYDWISNWATISMNAGAPLAKQVVEDLSAVLGIAYDMSGYTSRIEAEDIINVLRDSGLRGLSILKNQNTVTFIE